MSDRFGVRGAGYALDGVAFYREASGDGVRSPRQRDLLGRIEVLGTVRQDLSEPIEQSFSGAAPCTIDLPFLKL